MTRILAGALKRVTSGAPQVANPISFKYQTNGILGGRNGRAGRRRSDPANLDGPFTPAKRRLCLQDVRIPSSDVSISWLHLLLPGYCCTQTSFGAVLLKAKKYMNSAVESLFEQFRAVVTLPKREGKNV